MSPKTLTVIRRALIILVVSLLALPARARALEAADESRGREAPSGAFEQPSAALSEQETILYQLRAGEDPGRVARMFSVSVEELLALNQISDPHRIAVGATLKIPDPRAALVRELRAGKLALERQLGETRALVTDLKLKVDDLASRLDAQRNENQSLHGRLAAHQAWRRTALCGLGATLVLIACLAVALARGKDQHRRLKLAARQLEAMRGAVEKYRQLGAQLELKYQSLFRQVGVPSLADSRAQALRRAYEDERSRLDASVGETEKEIEQTLTEISPERGAKAGRAA